MDKFSIVSAFAIVLVKYKADDTLYCRDLFDLGGGNQQIRVRTRTRDDC
jgi:hypothetical protein